ncbi:sugar phosphate isomerase/epimerase [Conyzicola nivalis]|uniref:Xylose isomerase n=1 Tax=Conyzicola nivalis TaxID=1477021 RepID=A0A916SM28_9MICO|nr:TIM barrel protein [Conyzicola nivalis]GGB07172.1 xylose isomerase [Conyzicola nivalis]
MTPTVSVQLYSVRDAIAADLQGAVARLAEIGLRNVEPYGFAERVDDYERAFSASGISAPSGHAAVIDSDEPDRYFEAAVRLGIGTVIDPLVPTERWRSADDVAKTADRVNELTARAAGFGLAFGYHNHQWELANQIDGRHALLGFVDRLDDSVVLEIDTFWASVGGADTPALLRTLGDRVRFIHVKDGALSDDTSLQRPAGGGAVDVAGALAAAPQATRVIEFDAYAGDVFEGIAQSFAWLKENDS